jgi:hypothetical protein
VTDRPTPAATISANSLLIVVPSHDTHCFRHAGLFRPRQNMARPLTAEQGGRSPKNSQLMSALDIPHLEDASMSASRCPIPTFRRIHAFTRTIASIGSQQLGNRFLELTGGTCVAESLFLVSTRTNSNHRKRPIDLGKDRRS